MILNEFTQPHPRGFLGSCPKGHGSRSLAHFRDYSDWSNPKDQIFRKAVANNTFHQIKEGYEADERRRISSSVRKAKFRK